MRCPSCHTLNAETARYCGGCGRELTSGCPHCGAAVNPSMRFCSACGGALREDAPGAGGIGLGAKSSERRLISVLFVDLEGFSRLAEQMDPEDVRALQARYFESARAVVARYGGTLEKFIGDAVMAVWGAPIAHEDDAERAVRAALELVASVSRMRGPIAGQRLAARAAVATGEAAVTFGVEGHGLVAGDLVNTCSRLQAVAPAGRVLVDGATHASARHDLTYQAAGRVALRGKSRRVEAWLVEVQPAAAGTARAPRAHAGRFVGRDRELGELVDVVHRSAAERQTRLVTVLGIAGIGKSRLAWELERALDTAPEPIALHYGRAPSYGEGITFAPLAEMVRRRARITEGMEAELALRQLSAAVAEFVADADERAWIEARLAMLIDPAAQETFASDELFAAWRRFFEHVADWAPTLLVFEDAQWAEDPMLDFIEHLATWSRQHPLTVLVLARPELLDRRPGWPSGAASHTTIHLGPLDEAAMRTLVRDLLPTADASLLDRVVEQAGGVPLYAVEVARMFSGDPSSSGRGQRRTRPADDTLPIPDTLRALVAARLDALPAHDRAVVHAAAVLGHRFRPEALADVARLVAADASARIDELVRNEVLTLDDDLRSPGRGQLSFVQEVVRDVAYRTLARGERRTLHLAAAEHLGSIEDENLVEARAEHLREAYLASRGEAGAAEVGRRAIRELALAAQRATAMHASGTALNNLEHALAIAVELNRSAEPEAAGLSVADGALHPDGPTIGALRMDTALAARTAGRFDRAGELLRDAIADAETVDDLPAAARARALLASVLLSEERHASAMDDLETALQDLPDALRDPVGVELLGQLARARVLVGDDAAAIETARSAVSAARDLDLPGVAVDALITLGTARMQLGDEAEGAADLRTAIHEAQQRGLIRAELRARNNLAWLTVLDDPRLTLETARAGLSLALQMGVGDLASQLTDVVCASAVEVGEWDAALELVRDARERPASAAQRATLAATEATIRALRGERNQARALARLDLASDVDPQVMAAVDQARASVALLEGRLEESSTLADRAAEPSLGAERHSALVLAARASAWAGNAEEAELRLRRLAHVDVRGRAAEAERLTVEAAVATLRGRKDAADRYAEAITRWRQLDLPLGLGLALAERDTFLPARAGARRRDTSEGDSLLEGLGARGLLAALRRVRRRDAVQGGTAT